ncbi:hypothetical protein [Ornithinibacillus halophilus]|uniref:Uncharacterized protein n=1 Tax=Ornithinibacillus halophilus TaxID=930117 RepID=A0A1M5NCZ2_9BACI|nr:hypothetical protein [Ornithinibacillus halophilus]SHG87342.1 hypothetical protein SAMN05216225_10769 [Ornithinibacillus halophilus]
MKISTILKWITGGLEAFWGVPFIGGTIILSMAWTPLVVMLVLHIITLIFCISEERKYHGSILGIITSAIGWIPFVGMIMHIITAIFLLIDAYKSQQYDKTVISEM